MISTRAALSLLAMTVVAVGCGPAQEAATEGSPASPPAATAAKPAAPATKGGDTVVAVVAGTSITEAELRTAATKELAALRRQEYDTLKAALDNMIATQLMTAEATKKGTDIDTLLKDEIAGKIPAVTDADVDEFYARYQSQIGQPKEAVADRIRAQVSREKQQQALAEYLDGLKAAAGVKIRLEPPRTEVSVDDDPSAGPANAPVTIVEFSDFECGYCARVITTVHELQKRYGDKVRVVFRDYPLEFHAQARKAAEAAQCAHEQKKFWEYHDHLFANQRALDVASLKTHATTLGLDGTKFAECLDSGRYADEVQKDFDAGLAAGVGGTPAFFINGRFVEGAAPIEQFTAIIDDELQRQGV